MAIRKKLKLLQTHNITFTRHGSDTSETYIDEYGDSIAPTETSEIETCGSLQPFSSKRQRVMLPEGSRESDFLVYYTQEVLVATDLRTTGQFDNTIPDTCTIKGLNYKVTKTGDWDEYGLAVNNNEYVLQLIQPEGS